MQDEDKDITMGRSSDRMSCTMGRNCSRLDTAEEGEDVGAKPREDMFIWGRVGGGDRVSFIECRIGRGIAFE